VQRARRHQRERVAVARLHASSDRRRTDRRKSCVVRTTSCRAGVADGQLESTWRSERAHQSARRVRRFIGSLAAELVCRDERQFCVVLFVVFFVGNSRPSERERGPANREQGPAIAEVSTHGWVLVTGGTCAGGHPIAGRRGRRRRDHDADRPLGRPRRRDPDGAVSCSVVVGPRNSWSSASPGPLTVLWAPAAGIAPVTWGEDARAPSGWATQWPQAIRGPQSLAATVVSAVGGASGEMRVRHRRPDRTAQSDQNSWHSYGLGLAPLIV